MRYYCIISANPIFYISADTLSGLQDDYNFICNEDDEILKSLNVENTLPYSPMLFAQMMSKAAELSPPGVSQVWTLDENADLVSYDRRKPLYLYPDENWDIPSYSPNLSLVADFYALHPQLFETVSTSLLKLKRNEDAFSNTVDKNFPTEFYVSATPPELKGDEILGYVCIPITASAIPLNM